MNQTATQLTGQTFKVTSIQWDTDGDPDIDLPTEMEVIAESEDAVGDVLSDLTGFCHFGFQVEPATDHTPDTDHTEKGDSEWASPKAALSLLTFGG
ncbi:MAG: hypothetical protein AWU57_384 [Marinobacter sp. T13-3]|nr:MAG: hypothetical protein AWU57_384 [Marinobacter sp. T13-3]